MISFMVFVVISFPTKDFLIIDLAPYPVSGPFFHSVLNTYGLSGDYVTSEDFFDSLSDYRTVWVITSGNTQRWIVSYEAVSKCKEFIDMGQRGLFWQGYWDWFSDPGSGALRVLMGVHEPEYYVWNWYISRFEPSYGDTIYINYFPWIMVDFELREGTNQSEFMLEGIRIDRPGIVDVHPAFYGKVRGSRTVGLGFDIAAIWGPTSRTEFIGWILEYFGFEPASKYKNVKLDKEVKGKLTYGLNGRREKISKNGFYFKNGKIILYLSGKKLICKKFSLPK